MQQLWNEKGIKNLYLGGRIVRLKVQSVVFTSDGEPERLKTWCAIGRQLPSLWRVNMDHTPRTGYRKQTQNINLEFEILDKCTAQFKDWIRKITYNSLKSYTVLLPYFWRHYCFLLFSFAVLTWWFAQTSSWYQIHTGLEKQQSCPSRERVSFEGNLFRHGWLRSWGRAKPLKYWTLKTRTLSNWSTSLTAGGRGCHILNN